MPHRVKGNVEHNVQSGNGTLQNQARNETINVPAGAHVFRSDAGNYHVVPGDVFDEFFEEYQEPQQQSSSSPSDSGPKSSTSR